MCDLSPHDENQVKLAIQHLGIRRKRQTSPERRDALLESLAFARGEKRRICGPNSVLNEPRAAKKGVFST